MSRRATHAFMPQGKTRTKRMTAYGPGDEQTHNSYVRSIDPQRDDDQEPYSVTCGKCDGEGCQKCDWTGVEQ